jgi:hypothetical protein
MHQTNKRGKVMLIKTKLTNLICAVTIGSCVGLANASNEKEGCPYEKLEAYWDNMIDKATHNVYDPTGAQHMQRPKGFSESDMRACSELSMVELKKTLEEGKNKILSKQNK